MNTGEWLGVVFGSFGVAVFVTRHMLNNHKFSAKEADRIRDANIERLEISEKSFERDISKLNTTVDNLNSKVDGLEGNIKENSTIIFKLKSDVRKLKKISVRHKSLIKNFEVLIISQFENIDSLENQLLDIASNLEEMNDDEPYDISQLKRNVESVTRAIRHVRRDVHNLERKIVSEEQMLVHIEES